MKKYYLVIALIVCTFAAAAVSAQEPKKSPVPTPTPPGEEVVRISVTLVQADVVVKDKKGRQVTDLKAEDFEILEDGRPQPISAFSYVALQPEEGGAATSKTTRAEKIDRNAPQPPPVPASSLRPEDVRRTIVFVIDNMSFDSLTETRKALRKFVDEQMQPGDLVAVIRMGQGMSVFQQFTTDKRLLHLAIDGMQWMPLEIYGAGDTSILKDDPVTSDTKTNDRTTDQGAVSELNAQEEAFYRELRINRKFESLSLIVQGLEPLPGRKTVFLFSDSFRLFGPINQDFDNERAKEMLRRVTGQANRALVVFNTIDARGLQPLDISAAENSDATPIFGGGSMKPSSAHPDPRAFGDSLLRRRAAFLNDQDGMYQLANMTGGKFVRSTDPSSAIGETLGGEKGYYLIGYTPDEEILKSEKRRPGFHKLAVRVKRPGLTVVSRKEFYGVPVKETVQPQNNTPDRKLFAALVSPYHQGDVGLKLTSLFGHDVKEGSFVRSLLHVAAQDLTFTEEADGRQKALIRVVELAFDANGIVGEPVAQTFTIRVRKEGLERVRRDGVIYEMMVPVKKPGMYQVRAAVQDVASERIGAANELLDVPDVGGGGRLALSGLLVSGKNTAAEKAEAVDIQATTAVRKFRRGMLVSCAFIIYNAELAKETRRPQLDARLAVYRDGRLVYKTPLELPAAAGQQITDARQIVVKGAFTLGPEFGPGQYVLQAVVTDKLAKGKYRTSTRWVEFTVVE